jgi:multiple antibiotic resistance protein
MRFVLLVATHRARTLKASEIKARTTVPIAITESNDVLSDNEGNIEVTESGNFWSPRILSNTIFVAAGGIKPIVAPKVRKTSDQIISVRFLPTIDKNWRSNSEDDLLRCATLLSELIAVTSPVLTDSSSCFLKFRNLFLLDKCFAIEEGIVYHVRMTPFHEFAIVFAALFVITNPLGNLGVFVSITEGDSEQFKKQQALKASLYSFALLFVFFVCGKYILEFFGITINGIQIGGGIIIAKIGFSLMAARPSHLASKEHKEAVEMQDVSFCPLAMPMVAGPGGLAVVLSVAKKEHMQFIDYVSITAAIAAACLVIWICFRESSLVAKFLGETGMAAITKIMGFILICIAIQMIITGTAGVLEEWGIAKVSS